MKSSLYACIQDIQNGDREQALALLEKFSPLLKKYAFFLQSEDALQDFQCFLLMFAKNLQLNKLFTGADGETLYTDDGYQYKLSTMPWCQDGTCKR